MKQFSPLGKGPRIAVALSGGGDSMALAFLLQEWAKTQKGRVVALIVDHRLRPESATEAKQVAAWMKKAGIAHHILSDPNAAPSSNLQNYARELRYRLMTEWCQKNHFRYLATGHTYDDQVETFLLRLQRGSGVDGLAAMPAATMRNGVRILRPIMGFRREALREYLKNHNRPWIEDPTNEKPEYDRNAVRKLLRINPDAGLSKRFFDTALAMGRARAALEQETNAALSACLTVHKEGYAKINIDKFRCINEEIALRALRNALACLGGNATTPRFEKLHPLYRGIMDGTLEKPRTLWGCTLIPRKGDALLILRERARIPARTLLTLNTPILWDERFTVTWRRSRRVAMPYFISPLTPAEWQALRRKYSALENPFKPGAILHTLPALKTLSPRGIETILGVPHIHWYGDKELKNHVCVEFTPVFALIATPFTYWNA